MRAVFSVIILLQTFILSARDIVLATESDLQSQLTHAGQVYIVNHTFNLNDDTISLPYNATLLFSDVGEIVNGTIEGNFSKIIAKDSIIFNDIIVAGTWNQDTVYGRWFVTPHHSDNDNLYFKNLMILCSGKTYTNLYTPCDTFNVSAINERGAICVPSNVYWHNSSTIRMLPNEFEKFSIIHLDKVNNVTIDGGVIIGDVDSHIGDTGEWGHGIKCGGATNITLKNISCNYCWGDGIDLIEGQYKNGIASINCRNVVLDNVICQYNQRQGLSIEAAENVTVRNCEFSHTGKIKYTPPGAGIDIEPWSNNGVKIRNIEISNCVIHDNRWVDLQCMSNWKASGQTNAMVFINDCEIGVLDINHSNGVSLIDCSISNVANIHNAKNISFNKCDINKINKGDSVTNLTFKSCKNQSRDVVVVLAFGTLFGGCLSLASLNRK